MSDAFLAPVDHAENRPFIGFDAVSSDERLSAGYRYWLSLCNGRTMPTRADVDPLDIPPSILPWICLAERMPKGFQFRVVGTGHYDLAGRDLTGLYLEQISENKKYTSYIEDLYEQVAIERRPLIVETRFQQEGRGTALHRMMAPLGNVETGVTHVIVFQVAKSIEKDSKRGGCAALTLNLWEDASFQFTHGNSLLLETESNRAIDAEKKSDEG